MLTCERLREILYYDVGTGVFIWKISRRGPVKVGDVAGSPDSKGYRAIKIDGHLYRSHRLAWFYQTGEWPNGEIDHINGVRSDNRFANLREATHSENMRNVGRRADNASGFKGVCWDRHRRRWLAQITMNGKMKFLGYFDAPEEAYAAYCATSKEHHGEFARLT